MRHKLTHVPVLRYCCKGPAPDNRPMEADQIAARPHRIELKDRSGRVIGTKAAVTSGPQAVQSWTSAPEPAERAGAELSSVLPDAHATSCMARRQGA